MLLPHREERQMDMTSLLQQVGSLICYCGSNILLPEKALITVNAQIRLLGSAPLISFSESGGGGGAGEGGRLFEFKSSGSINMAL